MKSKFLTIALLSLFVYTGCTDDAPPVNVALHGTWIDTESSALQFMEFTSATEGRFGLFSKNFQQYENFTYRLTGEQLTVRFTDGDMPETTHTIQFYGDDKIEISDLTVIPENPTKTYLRSTITTAKEDNTLTVGLGDTYFDVEEGYRLRVDSVLSDSRCPEGVTCVWQGAVVIRITVIVNGNEHHTVDLGTYQPYAPAVEINGINYTLTNVAPYPKFNVPFDPAAYRFTFTAVRQNP